MSPKHSNTTPAWIAQRFAKLEKMIRESSAAKKLQGATIGKGGLTVKDQGSISTVFPDGAPAARFGTYTPPGENTNYGLYVYDSDGSALFGAVHEPITNTSGVQASSPVYFYDDFQVAHQGSGEFLVVGLGLGIYLDGATNGVQIEHSTTAAAANCYIDPSDNRIWRSTSSRRYKQDIEDAVIDPAKVHAMRAVTFRDKGDVERNGNKAKVHIGFLAEELDDLGLGVFVDYEPVWTCRDCDAHGEGHPQRLRATAGTKTEVEDPATAHAGETGHTIRRSKRPDSIAYDRLSVALLTVAQDEHAARIAQQAQIDELTARVAALEPAQP